MERLWDENNWTNETMEEWLGAKETHQTGD